MPIRKDTVLSMSLYDHRLKRRKFDQVTIMAELWQQQVLQKVIPYVQPVWTIAGSKFCVTAWRPPFLKPSLCESITQTDTDFLQFAPYHIKSLHFNPNANILFIVSINISRKCTFSTWNFLQSIDIVCGNILIWKGGVASSSLLTKNFPNIGEILSRDTHAFIKSWNSNALYPMVNHFLIRGNISDPLKSNYCCKCTLQTTCMEMLHL